MIQECASFQTINVANCHAVDNKESVHLSEEYEQQCLVSCCGQAEERGLAGLVRAQLGRALDKRLQCSAWAARPLSAAQARPLLLRAVLCVRCLACDGRAASGELQPHLLAQTRLNPGNAWTGLRWGLFTCFHAAVHLCQHMIFIYSLHVALMRQTLLLPRPV